MKESLLVEAPKFENVTTRTKENEVISSELHNWDEVRKLMFIFMLNLSSSKYNPNNSNTNFRMSSKDERNIKVFQPNFKIL